MYRNALVAIIGTFLLLGVACGGGGDDADDTSDKTDKTETAEKAGTADKTDEADTDDKADKADKADKTEAADERDEKDKTDKPPAAENEPTIEGLYAAMLGPDDIEALLPRPESWWPNFPEFNVGFDPTPSGIEGEQFWVAQSYEHVTRTANERLQATLILFDTEQSAEEGLAAITSINDEDSETLKGPSVGDESRYFTREGDASDPEGPPPLETTLRFRVGPVVGRISFLSGDEFQEPEYMAEFFTQIEDDIEAFIEGTLEPARLPGWMSELMPSDDAVESAGVGPVFGTATVPLESWALVDSTGDPNAVRDRLEELGATTLGLRRYGVSGEADLVVETVLLRMADEDAAASWAQEFVDGSPEEFALDPGDTGRVSAFTSNEGTFYELQFARGDVVGDVSCFAPFGETSDACEEPVRVLAEAWYAELPK